MVNQIWTYDVAAAYTTVEGAELMLLGHAIAAALADSAVGELFLVRGCGLPRGLIAGALVLLLLRNGG